MRGKPVKKDQPLGKTELPDLGSMTPKALELFERALAEKKYVEEKIETYASKPHPTVRELLLLAWFRNWLKFLEPRLPDGDSPTAASVWIYWDEHLDELRELAEAREEIISYLQPTDQIEADKNQAHVQMVELIGGDQLAFLAWYPVVEELYKKKKRGAPTTRRLTAVRALQMLDNNWKLKKVTKELCDCRNDQHDEHCQQRIRQSIISLNKLLEKCGVKPPKP
jgi:hypothetical protein